MPKNLKEPIIKMILVGAVLSCSQAFSSTIPPPLQYAKNQEFASTQAPTKLVKLLLFKKKYLEAKTVCENYLRQNPSSQDASYFRILLSESYLGLHSPRISKTILTDILKQPLSDENRAHALYLMAYAQYLLHDLQSSYYNLNEIIQKYPHTEQIERAYAQEIRELIELKKDKEASRLLDDFLEKLPENPLKKHAEGLLAKVYSRNGNLILSSELYLRAYGFPLFFLAGALGCLGAAGFYMGVFAIIKSFFRNKLLQDDSPKVFRPKHIFYFFLWMMLIPFTFDISLAWFLMKFHCSMSTSDGNQLCGLFFDLVLMIIALIYLRKKYRLDSKFIGFVSKGFKVNVLLPLAVVVGEFVIMLSVFYLFKFLNIKTHATPLHHMVETTMRSPAASNKLIMFTMMVVIAPITEEIVFRGFFYNAFKKHTNVAWAVILSAALFASGHDPQPYVFLILLISGIIWAVIYEKTKSLIPCMVCHMMHNSLAFIAVAATTRLH